MFPNNVSNVNWGASSRWSFHPNYYIQIILSAHARITIGNKRPTLVFSTGFGERVDTFFSPRIWHHAGRPTTGRSAETIGKNNKHNGRRTIARYPWNNRRSKPEFLQKMNLTNHIHLIIYTRLNDIWNGSSRSIFMILISFKSSQWDEYDSIDNFQVENLKRNLKFDNSDW